MMQSVAQAGTAVMEGAQGCGQSGAGVVVGGVGSVVGGGVVVVVGGSGSSEEEDSHSASRHVQPLPAGPLNSAYLPGPQALAQAKEPEVMRRKLVQWQFQSSMPLQP
jgi:hypothetical protein